MTEAEKNLELYLEKYCRQYGYNLEEAKNHALIKEVEKYYKETFGTAENDICGPDLVPDKPLYGGC